MITENVKWGIIGCGDVTEIKSGPAFQKVANSELVAVMRRNEAMAADFAMRHGVPKWYSDADDLINDPEVNAIYIATPPDSHADYCIKAMNAGKPVYVEKPMALNTQECQRMIEASTYTGMPLFVAYYRRALPLFVRIKQLIENKVIGDIKLINLKLHWPAQQEELDGNPGWRVFPEISGGGYFHDLASHQIDYLEYTLGPIVEAKGMSENQAGLYPAPDTVTGLLKFESGAVATGSWCFTVPEDHFCDQTEIIGSKGKITFSFFDSQVLHIETETTDEKIEIPHPEHVHQPLVDLVVQELRGEGACPSTGITGIRANMWIDKITGGYS